MVVWPWWWLAERGAVASGAFAKPLGATRWRRLVDTPQVAAAQHLIGPPDNHGGGGAGHGRTKMIQTG